MEFEQIVNISTYVGVGLFVLSGVVIMFGDRIEILNQSLVRQFVIGTILAVLGFTLMLVGERVGMEYYGLSKVGVNKYESTAEVVVPKEDKEIVTSKEFTITQLEKMYEEEYTGERYLSTEDVVEIKLDTTGGYKVIEE